MVNNSYVKCEEAINNESGSLGCRGCMLGQGVNKNVLRVFYKEETVCVFCVFVYIMRMCVCVCMHVCMLSAKTIVGRYGTYHQNITAKNNNTKVCCFMFL